MAEDWEERVAGCWRRFRAGELPEEDLVPAIDALAAERPADDPAAAYERASARDSVGIEGEAEPLYRVALAGDLDERRRPQATIQLASTLRLLGRLDESERLLREQLESGGMPDETRAFLALTLVAAGRADEATGHALTALAPHLSRYQRSLAAYAAEIVAS